MISFAVIKDKSKSSCSGDYTLKITKPASRVSIAPPPKVAIKKTYLPNHSQEFINPQNKQSLPQEQTLKIKQPTCMANPKSPIKSNIEFNVLKAQARPESSADIETTLLNANKTEHQNNSKIELKFPQHYFPKQKSKERQRIFPEEYKHQDDIKSLSTISKQSKSLILTTTIPQAQAQFEFSKKGKRHLMPRDSTYRLTIFQIQSIGPFEI